MKLFWKKRAAKPRALKDDTTVNAIFSGNEPKWQDWVMWAYPIINASLFTPAVVLTATTATYATYFLIALNFSLFAWHVNQTFFNLMYDAGNRKRHFLQFLIVSGFAVLGAYLALLALPVALPEATIAVTVFFVANFVTTSANFAATVCDLVLPWVLSSIANLIDKVRRAPKSIVLLPEVLITKSEESKNYSSHRDNITNLSHALQSQQLKRDKETNQEANSRFRLKLLNLCFTFRQRKLNKIAGLLRESDAINKSQSHASEIFSGTLSPSSNAYNFFSGRCNKNMMKLSFELNRLSSIEKASKKASSNKANLVDFLKTINEQLTIDGLETAVSKIESTDTSPVDILNDHIYFDTKCDTQDQQVKELVTFSHSILDDIVQANLTKLHDEEALTIDEIKKKLDAKYFKHTPKSDEEKLVETACETFKAFLTMRKKHGQETCPIKTHCCLS